MQNDKKIFAFKLASKPKPDSKWKTRDGLAVAGCTDPTGDGDYRESAPPGRDNGVWC